MEIAGIRFSLEFDGSVQLKERDAGYATFIQGENCGKAKSNIRIRLQLKKPPAPRGLRRIFDTGQSWAIDSDGERYRLILHPRRYSKPFWAADFDRKVQDVSLFCDPEFAEYSGDRVILDNPVCYPLDQLLLMYHLAPRRGLLVHAAGAVVGGWGIVFPGQSGAGKSTLARLWAARQPKSLLSDERVVVRWLSGRHMAFGTPWSGTAGIAGNLNAPLGRIFFLRHGDGERIKRIAPEAALERLLPVCSIPWYDPDVMAEFIHCCKDLTGQVPAFELDFRPGRSVVDFLEAALSG